MNPILLSRVRFAPVAAGALALLVAGCFGSKSELKKPGSAIWLTADSGEFTAADASRLGAFGLSEVFVDAGEIDWGAKVSIARQRLPPVPRRLPVTFAIRGSWQPGEREALTVAEQLASELASMRIEGESGGLFVVGYHFEVRPGDRGEHFAKTLAALRRKLDGKAFLSVGFDRADLDGEFAKKIAAASDFITCFLYGQLPGAAEDPSAWDLQSVEGSFRKLEKLDRPYLTGAITLGAATLLEGGKRPGAISTELTLGELAANKALELRPGFSLQGVDRQVFEFVAQSATTAGPFSLRRGDGVRVVRTATPLDEEFRRRVGAWESPLRLGDLYFRLPRPAERLSLSAENLVTVLGPGSSVPELALSLERTLEARDRWLLTARLENRGTDESDLAFFDSNFVEVTARGGIFLDAEPGQFRRVDLLHDGERGTMAALRQANQVRLHLPLLEGRQVVASGTLELRRIEGETPHLSISASFLLPDGKMLDTDPIEWSFEAR
jgi:hypothetical protein